MLQAQTHPVRDIGGGFNVIALYVNNADRDVYLSLGNLMDDFYFLPPAISTAFPNRQLEEGRKDRPRSIIRENKDEWEEPASGRPPIHGIGKYFDEAAGIFPMGIAAHRRFIECDFLSPSLRSSSA